ncbi:MAG: hypothetical protein HY674_08370 [Chloroflexi bacterium]|nr:hypothetical protein [Chloroflexota bacterium]
MKTSTPPAAAPPAVPAIVRPYLAPARLIMDMAPALRFREDEIAKRLFVLTRRLVVMGKLVR